jgi:hypothetical protein
MSDLVDKTSSMNKLPSFPDESVHFSNNNINSNQNNFFQNNIEGSFFGQQLPTITDNDSQGFKSMSGKKNYKRFLSENI